MSKAQDREAEEQRLLDNAAKRILGRIMAMDPTWHDYAKAAMGEHHWSAWQCLGAWVGHVLDNGMHMSIPQHPAFAPGLSLIGNNKCEACGKEFRVQYPGQRVCNNECAAEVMRPIMERARRDAVRAIAEARKQLMPRPLPSVADDERESEAVPPMTPVVLPLGEAEPFEAPVPAALSLDESIQ